jgi:hypothetical protein
MKAFFLLMLLVSVASAIYQVVTRVGVYAHNHYSTRYESLNTKNRRPENASATFGLTQRDLSGTDEHIANAYKVSVLDGYRLGRGYDALSEQGLVLAALLFITSIIGLRSVRNAAR